MEWELITRGYAEEYFPDFVSKVADEIKTADAGAKESTNNGDFLAALRAMRREEKREEKERQRKVAKRINNLPPKKRIRYNHIKHSPDNEELIAIAKLVNEGKTKQEIMRELGLSFYTLKGMLASARKYNMIPKDWIVRDRPQRNAGAISSDSARVSVGRKNHYVT